MIVGGVLEPIKDYFGTVENQGRGSLHLHLLIWLDHDMKPVDMKKNIRNTDFREKLKAYLEDIIKEDLDQFKDEYVFENFDVANTWSTPSRLTRDNIHAVISTMAPMKELSSSSIFHASPSANKLLRTLTHDRLKSDVTDDDVYDNEETVDGDNNNDEEHFQIQSAESDKKNTYSLTQQYSWKIIENIQLLHECKKDRDEHLLQVIAESQVENDAIDPVLLPANQGVDGEYDIDGSDQLLELLENLDEYTTTTANANKKSTENKYIEETIEAVENVGRFSHMNCEYDFNVSCRIENDDIKFIIASQ
ncbi:unnamed protein product [Rotaria socialis]